MRRLHPDWSHLTVSLAATLLAVCGCGSKSNSGAGGAAGASDASTEVGGVGGVGGAVDHPVTTCNDPQPWTPPAAPAACTDTAPTASTAADFTLTVDAGSSVGTWNRFYEKVVASDHAHTVICTAYGRNIQNALRKAHAQAGFQYVRFHGILNDDDAVYTEDALGTPIYDWSAMDTIYDAIIAAGMRPLVEISFTPMALASQPDAIQLLLWYNYMSPNISAPTGANADWTKWMNFMAALVQHLEDRYTQAEVRNWYFEVWNEPSWMYSLGDDGYLNLYRNTVAGLLQGDPMVRVGGPAGSAGESPGLIQQLITGSINFHAKLDFITYHRYADDNGLPQADVTDTVAFQKSLMNVISTTNVQGVKFNGEVMNDEFGPSYMPSVVRDIEAAASYIVKTVHLIGSDPTVPAPSSYGYWALSDLYEEIITGSATAYRNGSFGMMLKGDPAIPESYDVAKPSFNAFRLLHMMGDQQLGVTGGTTANGVGAAATRSTDGSAVQILVYNHTDGGGANSSTGNVVSLTVNNLPFTGAIRARQYIVDVSHANSYRPWVAMGSPMKPTQAQWVTLRDSAELCYYETTAQPTAGSWTITFPQNNYGVSLIEITGG